MIGLHEEHRQLFKQLDLLLKNFNTEEPFNAAKEQMTADKLAGLAQYYYGPVAALLGECDRLAMDNALLQGKVSSLEQDIKTLLRTLNQIRGYNQDFENLKQKHQIY